MSPPLALKRFAMNRKSKENKKDRKVVIETAYKKAVESGWHVGEAATWATKEHGSKINKADIQYYAMKASLPYLDEIKMGIRMKTI